MSYSLSVENLSFSIGKTKLLDNISFRFKEGKIIGILSANGNGKTTLSRCLAGVYPIKKESMLTKEETNPEKTPTIAYLEHDFNLPNKKNLLKTMKYYKILFPDFDHEKCLKILAELDIDTSKSVNSLSLGYRQLFYLSLILSRNAEITILDEPFSNIDILAREKMIHLLLNSYKENTYLFIATHYIEEMEKIFDHVLFIKDGKIIIDANADELREKQQKSIQTIFKDIYKGD